MTEARAWTVAPDAERLLPSDGLPDPPEGGWVWIDFVEPAPEALADACAKVGVSGVSNEQVDPTGYPTIRHIPGGHLICTRSLTARHERVATTPLYLILGPRGVVTVRYELLPGVETLADAAVDRHGLAKTPLSWVARLIDAGVRRYVPLVDGLEGAVESLEDMAIAGDPRVLSETQALRRDAAVLRGVLAPQRQAMLTLTRMEGLSEDEEALGLFRDTFDLMFRIVESFDMFRTMLNGVVETYRGAVAERTNDVMKVLTVFSAIFLPLTLIAGIYGMNFPNMPEFGYEWAYQAALGAMAVVAAGLWMYFVRRGFIGGTRVPRQAARGLVHLVSLPVRAVGTVVSTAGSTIRRLE